MSLQKALEQQLVSLKCAQSALQTSLESAGIRVPGKLVLLSIDALVEEIESLSAIAVVPVKADGLEGLTAEAMNDELFGTLIGRELNDRAEALENASQEAQRLLREAVEQRKQQIEDAAAGDGQPNAYHLRLFCQRASCEALSTFGAAIHELVITSGHLIGALRLETVVDFLAGLPVFIKKAKADEPAAEPAPQEE